MKKIITLFACLVSFSSFAQIGPEQGSLIIIGGGGMTPDMFTTFAEMMGGYDQEMIVIPTSAVPQSINLSSEKQSWINRGFSKVTVLHTTDPDIANTENFYAPIKTAAGIWFGGGRQWRTIDAYKNTKTEEEFHNLLSRGGVIMGSSAGASVQGSFLARGAEVSNVPIIAPELNHRVGFGFLKNSAIDQHADARNRWKEMYEVIELEPGILGFSIAEATAMFVQGNCFEVMGRGSVAVHDSTRIKDCSSPTDICYELISVGDFFDLDKREAGACDFITTSVSSPKSVDDFMKVYPNPAMDFINIEWNENTPANVNIEISDVMGRMVKSKQIVGFDSSQVDVSNFEKGLYLITLHIADRKFSSKFIKL